MVVFLKHVKVVFKLQNIVIDKNNFFSYGYEKFGDKWELKYDDFIIQIVQTTDNFKDLSDFRKLIIDTKSIFLFLLFSLIVTLLLTTVLVANRLGKKYIKPKRMIFYSVTWFIFAVSFSMSAIELFSNISDIEYDFFFKFPESPPYPK